MKATTVVASYERKINLGNFSNMTLAASVTIAVEDGDDEAAALNYGMELCRAQVRATALDALGSRTAPGVAVVNEFAGQPVDAGQNGEVQL